VRLGASRRLELPPGPCVLRLQLRHRSQHVIYNVWARIGCLYLGVKNESEVDIECFESIIGICFP
jgi:hypothetical protein